MRLALYTNSVSAHQLPLAREIVRRIGAENYRYIYSGAVLQGGAQEVATDEPWIIRADSSGAEDWLEHADALLTNSRDMELFERRSARGLKTFYQGERWFKPISPFPAVFGFRFAFPGWVRMWFPRYRRMANRFVKLAKADPNFRVLPIGPWACRDFLRIGIPGEKMSPWGYFVDSSKTEKKDLSSCSCV